MAMRFTDPENDPNTEDTQKMRLEAIQLALKRAEERAASAAPPKPDLVQISKDLRSIYQRRS